LHKALLLPVSGKKKKRKKRQPSLRAWVLGRKKDGKRGGKIGEGRGGVTFLRGEDRGRENLNFDRSKGKRKTCRGGGLSPFRGKGKEEGERPPLKRKGKSKRNPSWMGRKR